MLDKAICPCRNLSSSSSVQCCSYLPRSSSLRKRASVLRNQSDLPSPKSGAKSSDGTNVGKGTCCKSKAKEGLAQPTRTSHDGRRSKNNDVEAALDQESIDVSVQGMTCTGCENKLFRALSSIPGVSIVRVAFVNGSADFDLNTSLNGSETVIKQAREQTGYMINRSHRGHQYVDLQMPQDTATSVLQRSPAGVIDVDLLSKRAVRVTYDPRERGARSILAVLGNGAQLSPVDSSSNLVQEKMRLYKLSIKTGTAILFTMPVCVLGWANVMIGMEAKAIASLVLATLVQLIAVSELYLSAFRSLVYSRVVELDMLVVISITAAYSTSVFSFAFLVAGSPLGIKQYFETSTMLIALILLGRLITHYARVKSVTSVSVRSLQETTVTLMMEDGQEKHMGIRLLQFRGVFKVPPHGRIPTDGFIIEGTSDVDESMLSGESTRVTKSPGSKIASGAVNSQETPIARVERLPGQNIITDIANMIEAGKASRPRVQALADKVAGHFIPVVLSLAAIVLVVWIPVLIRLRNQPGGTATLNALSYAIAVLAVSCPCALGLAVPIVLLFASTVAARHGIIIKSAPAAERAWSVTDVIFDKTGTLTTSELEVMSAQVFSSDEARTLSAVLAIAKAGDHLVSSSVATYLAGKSLPEVQVEQVVSLPGRGIAAKVQNAAIHAGSPVWLDVQDHPSVQALSSKDLTLLCVTEGGTLTAIFALKTKLRTEAAAVVADLHRRNVATHLLSGDAATPVASTADALGIPHTHARPSQSPTDKRNYIDRLSCATRTILFCGEGTNDAIATARADIGIFVGFASVVTSSAAHVTLLGSLHGIPRLLDLSLAARRRVLLNFAWSALYNVFAVALAGGAFVVARLPAAYAGVGEVVSVLPILGVAGSIFLVGRWGRRGGPMLLGVVVVVVSLPSRLHVMPCCIECISRDASPFALDRDNSPSPSATSLSYRFPRHGITAYPGNAVRVYVCRALQPIQCSPVQSNLETFPTPVQTRSQTRYGIQDEPKRGYILPHQTTSDRASQISFNHF